MGRLRKVSSARRASLALGFALLGGACAPTEASRNEGLELVARQLVETERPANSSEQPETPFHLYVDIEGVALDRLATSLRRQGCHVEVHAGLPPDDGPVPRAAIQFDAADSSASRLVFKTTSTQGGACFAIQTWHVAEGQAEVDSSMMACY